MKYALLCAAGFLALAAKPALAQEAQCFQNDQYLVIAQQRTDSVGSDFIIRPPANGKIACVYEQRDGDRLIGNIDDPLHFAGLVGHHLVLTRSTGPQGDIVIYDLGSDLMFPLIDVRAEDEITLGDDSVTYWQRLILGTAANCPQYAEYTGYGFGAMIYEERILDLTAQTVAATGRTRCSNTQ